MKPVSIRVHSYSFLALCLSLSLAPVRAERVDNVLAQMVPDASVTLLGMRMDQLKSTPFFQKLLAQQTFSGLDEIAKETGFDPRRDVRDLLLAGNGQRSVLLARGTFHVTLPPTAKKFNYHGFVVISNADPQHAAGGGAFCILDSTLAAAGPLNVLEAALDQYKSGNRNNAAALLSRARAIPDSYQLWIVTAGASSIISENLPAPSGSAPDFARIFRSLQNTLFQADLRSGLKAVAEGYCTTAQDAKNLSDAARGMVGMGRLNTPENQPDLLRLWDGIKVEQQDKKVTLTADIGQDLIDQLLKLLQSNGANHKPNPRPAK